MKAAAVFPQQRELKVVDHPEPVLDSPTGVRLRLLEVGLCGTDREIAAFQYGTPPAGSAYLVIGHESLGQVVEVGRDVTRVRPGDLVVTMVRRPCPPPGCVACRAGRPDFCYTGNFTERGINGAHGFLTEHVVDDEQYMNVLPAALREVGVLTEPLTIAEKALAQVWQVQQRLPWAASADLARGAGAGHRAVVLGAGPVGLLGAMALVTAGFATTVYSRASGPHDKAALVRALGAVYIAAEDHTVDELPGLVGNLDLVYEATGASRVAFDLLRVLGTNAVFVFTGVPGRKGPIPLDADLLMRDLVLKNQVVFGTVNAPRAGYEAAVRDLGIFMARWPDAVRGLITGRYALEETARLLQGEPAGIKNVIRLA
ncbi:MAG: glucose 1-dehydrogenase [Candidatus Krumholzibacteriia bacterium]